MTALKTNWTDDDSVAAGDMNAIGLAVNALTGIVTQATAYTVTATDRIVLANATAAAFAVTLLDATAYPGKQITIKKSDSTVNPVTIATTASQTIDGMSSALLVFGGHLVTLVSDGANWVSIENNYRGEQLGVAELLVALPNVNSTVTDVALAANKIPGLSITTVGTGRPVKVRCQSQAYNTVANNYNGLILLTNGSAANGASASGSSPDGNARSLSFEANPVLALGAPYTFEVGMYCQASSQSVYYADSTLSTMLTVVGQ